MAVCNHIEQVQCPNCSSGYGNGLTWPPIATAELRYGYGHSATELTALRERVDGLHEELQAAHELRRITEETLEHLSAERDALRSQVRVLELLLHSKSRLWKWLRR